MIKQLRRKFIRIAMLAITAVTLTLCLTVNIAHFVSINADSRQLLKMISDNGGAVPQEPHLPRKENGKPEMPHSVTKETPYTTRFFILKYTSGGEIISSNLEKIASVTEQDTAKFAKAALRHGNGYGFSGGYKYYTVISGDEYTTTFIDFHPQLKSAVTLAVVSFAAIALCLVPTYIIIVLFSRRAIDPVVDSQLRQKQFITDAGHELKTPITVISTNLKILEMENGKSRWIDKAVAQTEKLTKLVNSLVTLSKADEEATTYKRQEFSASDAAEETAQSFYDYAARQNRTVISEIPPDIRYIGDEFAFRRLISILLENAVKYSDENSATVLSLKKTKKGIIITSENDCTDLKPDDLSHLFDRFYRADKARSDGGFGLGLSIARAVCEGHGGKISAEICTPNRVRFTATLC